MKLLFEKRLGQAVWTRLILILLQSLNLYEITSKIPDKRKEELQH